ncbi:sodium:proline symporter [Spirochaetia bacterium]|nr:sodium:proline symporter [Spirochaetia bacterium]
MGGIIMLAAYAVLMVLVTILVTKKPQNPLEFHVSNRKMGTIQSALSIAATWVWAPALFVSAERAYLQGAIGLFWFLIPNVFCLILFIPFAKKIREQMPQGITLSGFIGERYGKGAKKAYLFQLSALSVLSTGVNLLAGGAVLSVITGMPFWLLTVILAAIAYSYSQFSGIKASVLTDAVQMVLILAVCLLFVPVAFQRNGLHSLVAGIAGPGGEFGNIFSRKGWEVFLSFGLPTAIGLIAGPFGDQNFWQRAFTIKQNKIGKAFVLGAIAFGIVPLSMGILGYIACGSGFIPQNPGVVNLEIVTSLFPAWSTLPFVFMLVSGLLSTVDSNLCAMASLTTDITKSQNMIIPRGAMLVNLGLGILIANIPEVTITNLFLFYGTLRASTLAPTVMTLQKRKLHWVAPGVIVSLAAGLPLFAWGTFANLPLVKLTGSLVTLGASGIITLIGGQYGNQKRA